MLKVAIYPGTFDPMTNGHIDVVKRAAKMFDQVILAVAANPGKGPFFSLDERVELATQVLGDMPNVKVMGFSGLLVKFAKEQGASVIVRGLRAIADFEYEVQLAGLNRQMEPDIETVFIAASQEYSFLSSSIVREIAKLGGELDTFVHPIIVQALDDYMRRHRRGMG